MSIIVFNNKEFKQYPRNHTYFVSRDGEIYSTFSKRLLKSSLRGREGKEYLSVDIYIDGKQKHIYIHKMVYETWEHLVPHNTQINHKDDNQFNNNIDNLYIGTQQENINDCKLNNRRIGNIFYLVVYDKNTHKTLVFIPSQNFIKYCGHKCNNLNVSRMFTRNWFKQRYIILKHKRVKTIEEYTDVTTMGDECNPVE